PPWTNSGPPPPAGPAAPASGRPPPQPPLPPALPNFRAAVSPRHASGARARDRRHGPSQRHRRGDFRPALGGAAPAGDAAADRDRSRDRTGGGRRPCADAGGLMDPRLLRYYQSELDHLQEMGAEFAQQFPKTAARRAINGTEIKDPYVERLVEGAAFLAARVQLKLDSEFPRFTQSLLEIVYPHYLAPTPSMLVAQLHPDLNDPGLA